MHVHLTTQLLHMAMVGLLLMHHAPDQHDVKSHMMWHGVTCKKQGRNGWLLRDVHATLRWNLIRC